MEAIQNRNIEGCDSFAKNLEELSSQKEKKNKNEQFSKNVVYNIVYETN